MCYNTAHERKIALRVDDIPAFRRTFHPDEANQAKFVITVAAIGMAAHILDEKEKAEKTEKEQTEA